MRIWRHHLYSDEQSLISVSGDRVTVGHNNTCDVVLPSAFVADQALVLEIRNGRWEVEAQGANGCQLSGFRLLTGQRAVLDHGDEISISPFVLRIDLKDQADAKEAGQSQLDAHISDLIRTIHVQLLDAVSPEETEQAKRIGAESLLRFEHIVEELALAAELHQPGHLPLLKRLAGHAVRGRLVDRIIGDGQSCDPLAGGARIWTQLLSAVPQREDDFESLVGQIANAIRVSSEAEVTANMDALENRFWSHWETIGELLHETYLYLGMREVKKQVKDLVFGYGPIEDLLRVPTITEIMVISHEEIYVEKTTKGSGGSIEKSGRRFVSDAATLAVIERIVQLADRQIDQSRPMVDARLEDGSRVNAVIAPIALSGPCLTIRKNRPIEFAMADWEQTGLSEVAARFLKAVVKGRRSLIVVGGTGSGKTTLLNCLAEWIDNRERLVTIEDTAELRLKHDHVVQLQTKTANVEGAGEIRIRDLVRNALRMRPDRIIVGECRGAEALDMLQAMNTGHNGSMTTLHANSAKESIARLEVMVKSAMDLPLDAIHRQIASAIDIVIEVAHEFDEHLGRKERRIRRISEVRDVDPDTGCVDVRSLYELHSSPQGPQMLPTGRIPSFAVDLADQLAGQGLFDLECFFYKQPA
jgi:Flp pilus assembly CpaF family ATPase